MAIYDVDLSEYIIKDASLTDESGNTNDNIDSSNEKPGEETDRESNEKLDEQLDVKPDEEALDGDNKDKDKVVDEKKSITSSITDDSEIEIDGEKVKITELKDAYNKRRSEQADYTRKTQALADQRREFEAQESHVREEIEKIFTDPDYLVSLLKRKARSTLHSAMVKYGTEYAELMELKETNPAAYFSKIELEQKEIERLNTEDKIQRETKAKEKVEYERMVSDIRKVIVDNKDKALTKYGILPSNANKEYKDYIDKRFHDAYIVYVTSNRGIQITPEVIHDIAKELSNDAGVKATFDSLKNKKEVTKPVPKINKVESKKDNKKPIRTHENFFDTI